MIPRLLPVDGGVTHAHVRGVTLLGDTAHLSRRNGEGANQAMLVCERTFSSYFVFVSSRMLLN
jgi:hypothetical protein